MERKFALWIFAIWFTCLSAAFGATPSPVGLWRAYDDDGTARSIMRFYVANNHLQAKIVKSIGPKNGSQVTANCTQCPAPWTNKPFIGMVVIWGLTQQADGTWTDGSVLDTDAGKVYKCNVSVSPDGKTLHFHAYMGVAALGKTIDWSRVN